MKLFADIGSDCMHLHARCDPVPERERTRGSSISTMMTTSIERLRSPSVGIGRQHGGPEGPEGPERARREAEFDECKTSG